MLVFCLLSAGPQQNKNLNNSANFGKIWDIEISTESGEFENGISLNHNSNFTTKSKFVNIFKYNWMLTHPSVVKDILKQNDIFTDLFLKFVCFILIMPKPTPKMYLRKIIKR